MNRTKWAFTIVLVLPFSVARAQSERPLQQHGISQALDSWISNTERNIVPVADVMPEGRYSFAPAPASGEFTGVRTFAQQLKHLAADNYWMAAIIVGDTATPDMYNETGPDSVRTKAAIMDYLRGSFAALHRAVATIDQGNAVEPIRTTSAWQTTRLSFAVDAVAHSFDHYGQLVEYLRMNGIVPPASRPGKP
jgi:uncharacterized damage-inducible protein DinB